MRKRIVSLLMCLVLILNLVPTSVWATEPGDTSPSVTTETTGEGAGDTADPLDTSQSPSEPSGDAGGTPADTGDTPDDTTQSGDQSDDDPSGGDTTNPPGTEDNTIVQFDLTSDFFSGSDWETCTAEKYVTEDMPMLFYAPSTTTAYINISGMNGYTNTATGQKMSWHFIDDGGYIQVAWCIQPSRSIVNNTAYALSGAMSSQTLKDVLQIAYEWGYWSNSNSFNATYIAATQVAVWWALGYTSASCSNSTVNSYATSLYNAAIADYGCGGGGLYGYTCTTNSSYQALATYYPYRASTTEYGDIRIYKTSADPTLTSGNSNYSLAGAVYGIYGSRSNANNDRYRLDTLTTYANGYTGYSDDLESGYYYYVKEITAPTGYKLDTSVYQVYVDADMTTLLQVSDEPEIFTGKVQLKKSSANPDITDGNDCYSLQGAVYGVYGSRANANSDTNRLSTLTTDANGVSNVSGDLESGYTYYIKELTAPKGYALDTAVYTVAVEANKTAVLEVKDTPQSDPVGVILKKVDATTGKGETCS